MAGTGTKTHKVFLPPSFTPPTATPKTIPPPVGAPGSSASFNLGDNQKRWLVTGICLNKTLLPTLRDFVEPELIKLYTQLRTNHNIDKQIYHGQLTKDGKCNSLNYGSINNNEANYRKKTPKYDYNVKSPVDLAKLYLQPFMAKFTGFDDTCDLSAVLGILSSASVFSAAVQGLSSDVKKDVRNEWGHCNFVHWNGTKFAKCFQLMDSLIRALNLSPTEEKRATDELQDWETKGLKLCMGSVVDADLVNIINVEVSHLNEIVKLLDKSQKDEALRVSNGLKSVWYAIEEYNKTLDSLKESQDILSQRVDEDVGALKVDQKHLASEVDSIKMNTDTLTKRVDEVEEKHDILDRRVEALETAIETKSSQQAIITFQAPNRIPCFHGRVEELGVLAKPLQNKLVPCSMTAVYGLGGTGKTSLAIEHIWRSKEAYSGGVFWISGESNSLFDLSMREMARQIGTFDDDFKTTLSKTIGWLQERKEFWCLVIDNLDELDLSTEMLKLIDGHWKRQATGHILITTRRKKDLLEEEVSELSEENCIGLSNLSEAESVEFIKMRTGRTSTRDNSVILELVVELGTLPLALDQAAAFIKNRKEISFSQYLNQYKKQKLNILKRSKARYPVQNTSKDRIAVHTTWQLNFEYVSRLSEEYGIGQAAALVMEVCAFLSPDDIPNEIINQGLPHVNNGDLISCLSTSFGVTDIVGVLTKYSLFQIFTDKSFSVHRLVQEVIRSRISLENRTKHVLQCACRMMCSAFANTRSPVEVCKSFEGDSVFSQDNPPSLRLWGKLGAHASVFQKYLIDNSQKDDLFRQEILYTEESAIILNEASMYLGVCRQKVEAMELQASKLKVMTQLGEVSKETLDCLRHFDIPLKNVEFKLISHCMANQDSISTGDAVSEISNNIDKDAQESNQLREKGNEAVKKQNYEDAINLYSQAVNLVKDDPRLYNNRALCYLKVGKPEEALHDCESCLKLEERNGKALMRKAWALYELSKSQGEHLKGRMVAAAALAACVNPAATEEKPFKTMFPNLMFEEICNPLQLAGSLMLSIPGTTLLLHDGYYELHGTMIDEDIQLVGLGRGVILKFQALPILSSSFYAEGIVFAKDSGGIVCTNKGSLNLFNCQISGGFRCCEDLPDCNGGPGCIAVNLAGCKPCDRTGKFGEPGISGICGTPSIIVTQESTGHIEKCEIINCGGGGILCVGDGSSLIAKSCRVNRNGQAALEAREGGCLDAIDNEIYANRLHGILIGPSAGKCNIANNRIYENVKEGILVIETMDQEVVVEGNKIFHNLAFGISLDRCQVAIKSNEIFENNFYGIHAKTLTTAVIERNDIYSNKCGGIQIGINFSGRIFIKSNVVRDHNGPWILHGDNSHSLPGSMASSDPYGKTGLYLPKGETRIYTLPPIVTDNNEKNNKEKAFHPKEKIESVQGECAFCRNSQNLQRCSRCNVASYCNQTCQKRHWEKHKALCSALKYQYSVTVEPRKFFPSDHTSIRTFGPHLKGIGKGPKPDPKSKRRFVVKIQTQQLNGHPRQNLTVYDKSLSIDGSVQSPEIFHVIMECGVLGQMNKFTSKKAYFFATFADGGKKLNIYLGELAPYKDW